jgi:chemotaxis methyl-accepting protein methylase
VDAEVDRMLSELLSAKLGQGSPWPAELHRHVIREARARGLTSTNFLARLAHDSDDFMRLVQAATVPRTAFFRHPEHFARLTVFAHAVRERSPVLRVLSLGCATGEEVWSIALCLCREAIPFRVLGRDVNPAVIATAREGRYSALQSHGLERVTSETIWAAPDSLRPFVHFDVGALHDPLPPHAPPRFDVVFCRNLLIYLEPANVQAAWQRFFSYLEPWGAVAVGPAESFAHVPPALERAGPNGWFERRRTHP